MHCDTGAHIPSPQVPVGIAQQQEHRACVCGGGGTINPPLRADGVGNKVDCSVQKEP